MLTSDSREDIARFTLDIAVRGARGPRGAMVIP